MGIFSNFSKMMRVLVVLALMMIYGAGLWGGLTEENRRSLSIVESSVVDEDYVVVNVRVTSIDTAQGLLHERIRLIPKGRFAIDRTTPAIDLKLLINTVSGKQTVVFPKGERIFPVDFSSYLTGNQNKYPFDHYLTDIDFLVTIPAQKTISPVPEGFLEDNVDPLATTLIFGANDLNRSETIPIKENFVASIPGVKFDGTVTEDKTYNLMQTSISVRRANFVVSISIVVMTVMFGLAVSIMGMVLQVTASPGEINLLPLSLCVALIFGLPALRNIQPGVPGVGALSDYISFIWAEFIVSTAAIALAWIWIIRSRSDRRSEAAPGEPLEPT